MPSIERLKRHVETLAATPRVPGTPEHAKALKYVFDEFNGLGWDPDIRFYKRGAVSAGINLHAERGPRSAPLIIIGAHYDSVPTSPGADDNASGVAALLELARLFKDTYPTDCRIHLVAYDEEERGLLGSTGHALTLAKEGETVHAMMSLEMLGYTSPEQQVPRGMPLFHRGGDFLAVVANVPSAEILKSFRCDVDADVFHIEPLVIPVPLAEAGVAAFYGEHAQDVHDTIANLVVMSDHMPFWKQGWPALLVTDTAHLRNPNYHRPSDTPMNLDYEFLAKSTKAVFMAMRRLMDDLRERGTGIASPSAIASARTSTSDTG